MQPTSASYIPNPQGYWREQLKSRMSAASHNAWHSCRCSVNVVSLLHDPTEASPGIPPLRGSPWKKWKDWNREMVGVSYFLRCWCPDRHGVGCPNLTRTPPSTAVGVSIHRARLTLRELESLWQDQPPAPRAPRLKPEVGTGARWVWSHPVSALAHGWARLRASHLGSQVPP